MRLQREEMTLNDPNTHSLIHEALALTNGKDCMEVYYDMCEVVEILKARMYRSLQKQEY